MLGLTQPMLKSHRVSSPRIRVAQRRRLIQWSCSLLTLGCLLFWGFTAGEWGDHIKWMFVPTAKDNRLLPPPVLMKQTFDGISTRTNLVIAPVADTSEHRLWLRDFPSANWDMVAIYYGSNATTFDCEECIHVEANRGPKWQVVYQFTQGEAFKKLYSKQYQQVYIPDDDIIQTTAIINSIFDIQARYSLDLCQPSLCSPTESYTWTVGLWKELPTVLRYTTFIEVMVTQFSMDFFLSDVVDTLRYAESAYGLDWVWPFKLGFPQDRIAIIDEVCVIHPTKATQSLGKASMYDTMTMLARTEEKSAFKRYHYTGRVLKRKYGMAFKEQVRLGQVWQPWYAALLQQAGLRAESIQKRQHWGPRKEVRLVRADMVRPGQGLDNTAGSPQEHALTLPTGAVPVPWLARLTRASRQQAPLGVGGRRNLVVSVVSEASQVHGWLQDIDTATWDVVLYVNSSLVVDCPQCLFMETFDPEQPGSRFTRMWQLTQTHAWQQRVVEGGKYEFIYFPEDIIVQSGAMVNRLFELAGEHRLDIAHPSLCSDLDSTSLNIQFNRVNPHRLLRFTSWVDSLAPLFSFSFFQESVVATLENAHSGYGLDYIWPWLAGFPQDRIAIVDDLCVLRPAKPLAMDTKPMKGKQLLYAQQEERDQLRRAGYNPILWGVADRAREVFSDVPQAWYQRLLELGNLQGKKRFFIGRAGNYDEQAAQQELEALISQHSVVTFGWTFCPFARRAKELLAELGADFEAVELNQLPQGPALRAELIKKTNRTSVPNVFINGASFGGLNDGPGILTLHKEGQLEPLLREAGALKS